MCAGKEQKKEQLYNKYEKGRLPDIDIRISQAVFTPHHPIQSINIYSLIITNHIYIKTVRLGH
jgi:hypothetical protein